jgi:hypothetical protein
LKKNIRIDNAIKKLEASNQELKITLEQLNEQFEDLRADPRFSGFVNDLEELGFAYLRTWLKSNNEILDILKKEKSKFIRFKTK